MTVLRTVASTDPAWAEPTTRLDDVDIRTRHDQDLGSCVAALQAVHEADGYPTWWPDDPVAWLSPAGCAVAWVACEDDGSVVGHVCLVGGVDDPVVASLLGAPTERLVSVSRLFTSPTVRGRGLALGAQLLAAAQQWTQQQGLQLMLDVVDDGAPAVSLYERLGWRLVDRRDADWTTPQGARHRVRIHLAPEQQQWPQPTDG